MRGFGLAPDDITPRGEDGMNGQEGQAIHFWDDGSPPGENRDFNGTGINGGVDTGGGRSGSELELQAQDQAETDDGSFTPHEGTDPSDIDFLDMVRDAEALSSLYVQQNNRRAWTSSYRAYHNEHAVGSRYTQTEWRGRSRLFIPKTRAAVRKDQAAVAASLFNSVNAIDCLPGNEADPQQQAAAALMEEIVNYRVGGRASGRGSIPWFLVAMGSRQDAVLTGVCCSKQYWLQKFRRTGEEPVHLENPVTGVFEEKMRDVFELEIDRPDILPIPPENYSIDASADWRNPVQSSSYFIVHWPMQLEDIKEKQNSPVNPWLNVSETELKSAAKTSKFDTEVVRRARELGLDRMDETQTGTEFQVIWVSEVFIRTAGEDWTFYCVGNQFYLTNPRPVREVYPEQHGERPLSLGYGALESHRIYPMAAAESWQPLQAEANDLRNLMLDAVRQNVMPVSKIRRGRQIDLDQVRRRSSGTSIIVQEPDDVTWDNPPQIPATAIQAQRELSLEFDDLAGQQNYGSVETNNALGKTLGGLKLAAGAANAVQEFDVRVWVETWCAPTLQQIVRLEQYYESDEVVLGICGAKAKLWQKFGLNQINDHLLEQDITVRVSVGLGAGDPQQRLAKFNTAAQIIAPLCAQSPDFQSGKKKINIDAIIDEVFGACGYKDGGKRFFEEEQNPKQNPMQDLAMEKLKSEIEKNNKTGQAAWFSGISDLAKVALGKRELENAAIDNILGRQNEARQNAFEHTHRLRDQHLSAMDHGHRHGSELAGLRSQASAAKHGQDMDKRGADREDAQGFHGQEMDRRGADREDQQHQHSRSMDERRFASEEEARKAEAAALAQEGEGEVGESASPTPEPSPSPAPAAPPTGGGNETIMQLLQKGEEVEFVRDPATGRISGARLKRQPTGAFPAPRGA